MTHKRTRELVLTVPLQRAIRFSIKTHEVYQKQKRKGKDIAYITHPLSVGIVLARIGADDDVVTAGILHDTIEDSIPTKKVTQAMLAERFGKKVANLVESVTNRSKHDATYEQRHHESIARVASYRRDAVLVRAADVVCNVNELIDDYGRDGERVFERFTGTKEQTIAHNLCMIDALLSRRLRNPFKTDLETAAQRLKVIVRDSFSSLHLH